MGAGVSVGSEAAALPSSTGRDRPLTRRRPAGGTPPRADEPRPEEATGVRRRGARPGTVPADCETGRHDAAARRTAGQLELLPDLARARAQADGLPAAGGRRGEGPPPVDPAPELPVARVLVDVPLAHLDRPFDYLVPRKLDEAGRPRLPGEGPVRRPGRGRLRAGAGRRLRPSRPAGTRCAGRSARAGALAGRGPAGRGGRGAATPAPGPTCSGWPCRRGTPPSRSSPRSPPSPRRSTRPPRPRPGRPYDAGALVGSLAAGGRPGRSGRRCPERTGPHCWLRPPPPHCPPAGARCCASPDHRDVARVDAAVRTVLGEGRHVVLTADSGPADALPLLPRRLPGRGAGGASAPGRPPSRRCTTWAWWRCGTTATTSTPSHGRPTRTPGRCC